MHERNLANKIYKNRFVIGDLHSLYTELRSVTERPKKIYSAHTRE